MDSTILNAVSTVGFPIVVTLYLLVRFQTSMDNFSRKVDELIIEIRKGYYSGGPLNCPAAAAWAPPHSGSPAVSSHKLENIDSPFIH